MSNPSDFQLPLISILIVNWNSGNDLSSCIQSILSQSYTHREIIIIDNGSTDDSLSEFINKEDLILIHNSENLGFSVANNQGLNRAMGDWIFLLNSDAQLETRCLEKLMDRALEEESIGSVSPKILRMDKKTIDSTGLLLQKKKFCPMDRGQDEIDSGQYDHPEFEEIFGPCAAAALYRRKALGSVSIGAEVLDEDFFAYYEDVDIAWRLQIAGWRTVFVKDALAFHRRGGPQQLPNPLQRQAFANRYFCFMKNEQFRGLLNYILPALFHEIGRVVWLLFKQPHMCLTPILILKKLPLMLEKRRWIQKRRKVSAKDLAVFD